jgi:hypothetical protein
MSWKVISRDSLDLTSYIVLPFGRFNMAEPFVSEFVNSTETVSDLLTLDSSNAAALRRAIVKLSGLKFNERNSGKKTKKGKAIILKTIDANLVREACNKLAIELETVASENAEGKLVKEFIQLRKSA